MSLTAKLENVLNQFTKEKGLGIKGWRFVVNETQLVSVGIKDNTVGTVYTPPSFRKGERGEVFIVWDNDYVSRAAVESETEDALDHWRARLMEWKEASYLDPDDAEIVQPSPIPVVAVEDRTIYDILMGKDEHIFAQVNQILQDKPKEAKVDGGVYASWGFRHLRTSKGLAVTYQESQYALSYSFDSIVGAGFNKRRLIEPEEWTYLWDRTINYYSALGKSAPPPTNDSLVILAPSLTSEMIGQFIVPNFFGQRILEGQSTYSKTDFDSQEQIFDTKLSLIIDPLKSFEPGSYLITAEGVPAQKTVLVQSGCLNSPYLRLKDAKRWGSTPTALPGGTAALDLQTTDTKDWYQILQGIEDGVLILSVLGLHTQDSVSGDYTLSAPRSLRIIKGEVVGRIDVKISGNFFRNLANSQTTYAYSPFSTKPYTILSTSLQIL